MGEKPCPFCFGTECVQSTTADYDEFFHCKTYDRKFHISRCVIEDFENSTEYQKILNLVCETVVRTPVAINKKYLRFYYDSSENIADSPEYINLYSLLKHYPTSIVDVTNRALINLSKQFPTFGERFMPYAEVLRLCYCEDFESDNEEGVLKMLVQMGFLEREGSHLFSISAEGWKKVEMLQKEQRVIKQGFVAMRFGEQTKDIREGFRQGIIDAGYTMRAIDEKEHNNQIVPEILYEIERSAFVVVDVTYPNYGAYYEAGYAQGLGKQVIVCCSREAFENKDGTHERPHFDISQKSMVIWDDIDDLKSRLKRRIEATV